MSCAAKSDTCAQQRCANRTEGAPTDRTPTRLGRKDRSKKEDTQDEGRQKAIIPRMWTELVDNANMLERVSLLAAILVLLTGLFYRTVYLVVEEQECADGDECSVTVANVDGPLRLQLMAVDIACLSVVGASALYVGLASIVPVVTGLLCRKA